MIYPQRFVIARGGRLDGIAGAGASARGLTPRRLDISRLERMQSLIAAGNEVLARRQFLQSDACTRGQPLWEAAGDHSERL